MTLIVLDVIYAFKTMIIIGNLNLSSPVLGICIGGKNLWNFYFFLAVGLVYYLS